MLVAQATRTGEVMTEIKLHPVKPYALGVQRVGDRIWAIVPISCQKECGIIFYQNGKELIRITFPQKYAMGTVYTVEIEGLKQKHLTYRLFADGKDFLDPYANLIVGREKWGEYHADDAHLYGVVDENVYDWEDDDRPRIPFHESILYHAHVRGFTKHSSSGVKYKGTFEGATEKIPYLKQLGVTGVLFMPMYDFDEIIRNNAYLEVDDAVAGFLEESQKTWKYKLNYWGFGPAAFFAPKASYAHGRRSDIACKDMVKAFHAAGIEVLMQMYFPVELSQEFIFEVVRYWSFNYHIDGFLLQGENIPQKLLMNDPFLANTKLIFERKPEMCEPEKTNFKHVGFVNQGFLYECRKFLKSDSDMLRSVSQQIVQTFPESTPVNQIAGYNGFTMMDLVSYNGKHNESNGEDNRDGSDYNYSWNCGIEGPTRKKTILNLRKKQFKNAMSMVFLSQGTPLILSGDEFGNSHDGNNNAYLHDNKINWLNWKELDKNAELFDFTKRLIAFRKSHPVLHPEKPFRQMDYIGCGYPDVSYHSESAWYSDFAEYNRHMGVLYCGKYGRMNREEDDFIYVLYNMHWISHTFALPKLPVNLKWHVMLDTSQTEQLGRSIEKQLEISVDARSIIVLKSVPDLDALSKKEKSKKKEQKKDIKEE